MNSRTRCSFDDPPRSAPSDPPPPPPVVVGTLPQSFPGPQIFRRRVFPLLVPARPSFPPPPGTVVKISVLRPHPFSGVYPSLYSVRKHSRSVVFSCLSPLRPYPSEALSSSRLRFPPFLLVSDGLFSQLRPARQNDRRLPDSIDRYLASHSAWPYATPALRLCPIFHAWGMVLPVFSASPL